MLALPMCEGLTKKIGQSESMTLDFIEEVLHKEALIEVLKNRYPKIERKKIRQNCKSTENKLVNL